MFVLKFVFILLLLAPLVFATTDTQIYYQLVILNNNIQQLNDYVKNLGETFNQTVIDMQPSTMVALNTFNQYAPKTADDFDKIVADIHPLINDVLSTINKYIPMIDGNIDKIVDVFLPIIKNLYK